MWIEREMRWPIRQLAVAGVATAGVGGGAAVAGPILDAYSALSAGLSTVQIVADRLESGEPGDALRAVVRTEVAAATESVLAGVLADMEKCRADRERRARIVGSE